MNWSIRYANKDIPSHCMFCHGINHMFRSSAREWNNETADQTGLPRPSVPTIPLVKPVSPDAQERWRERVVVPWNSSPLFDGKDPSLGTTLDGAPAPIFKNEAKVQTENRCAMCGEQFNGSDQAVRFNGEHANVVSDHYPMHERCMDITTRFCPHMMGYAEDYRSGTGPFERGQYKDLRINADNQSRESYRYDRKPVKVQEAIEWIKSKINRGKP